MKRDEFVHKIKTTKDVTIDQIAKWAVTIESGPVKTFPKPNSLKKGDVFMHNVFRHPVVLVKRSKDMWFCMVLTTEPTCKTIITECKSRTFSKSFITKHLFIEHESHLTVFLGVYDNNKHLTEIYLKLNRLFQ